MKAVRFFLLFFIAAQLISCGKSEKQLASEKLQLAESYYQQGDTTLALQLADSVQNYYKGAIQQVVSAGQFKKKVYGELLYKAQDELDSVKTQLTALQKNFVTEKTEFDRYTQFIHKRQQFQRRWNKSFIQIYLDERGEIYISSNYYGKQALDHTGIRVYDGDLQAKTEQIPVGSPLNHQSDFMNMKWEKVSYTDGKENGVIAFIAEHADRNLKAVFLGKRYYYIILEKYDKEAFVEALALSKALKRKAKLEQQIKTLQSKVG
ncbi:hypothetical protein [Mangrovibacterium marinum]|uniref:Uncharacterized protein n=1 Tax=Mangrovibacterium marinum TaxID=1639118 RepID=A0A2T5C126_9BACT|nr:hypothetical protein [Mangrovibacterium marinum]PTN08333.1 hypothetical protein C8N47_10968 [Mangrovibacterium marinum]